MVMAMRPSLRWQHHGREVVELLDEVACAVFVGFKIQGFSPYSVRVKHLKAHGL